MQKTINYKTKTRLIEELLKQENIKELKKTSLLDKLTFKKKEFADIYFHVGQLDAKIIENIKNAKKVIVNSITSKYQLIEELELLEEDIELIYPSVDIEYRKPKEVKIELCEKLEIDPKKKIVFFNCKKYESFRCH